MGRCETCGNEYDKAFEITLAGQSHVFDSLSVQFTHWRRNVRIVAVR
jgi:hypothetical protein